MGGHILPLEGLLNVQVGKVITKRSTWERMSLTVIFLPSHSLLTTGHSPLHLYCPSHVADNHLHMLLSLLRPLNSVRSHLEVRAGQRVLQFDGAPVQALHLERLWLGEVVDIGGGLDRVTLTHALAARRTSSATTYAVIFLPFDSGITKKLQVSLDQPY